MPRAILHFLRTRFGPSFCALLFVGVGPSCAGMGGPSADERAERLNRTKSLAVAAVDNGEYRRAIDLLLPLSREASADYQLFTMLARAYEGLGVVDSAITAYESAIRTGYTSYDSHLGLAKLLMEQGKTGRALTEFQLAARYGDREAIVHYNYGLALYELGRPREALGHWRRAQEIDPGSERYAEAVGIGLTDSNPSEAVMFFEKAEALGASGDAFQNNYGLALSRGKKYGEAAVRFERALEEAPDTEAYMFNLASALMNGERYREARDLWERLISVHGEKWRYRVYGARANLELEDFAAAVRMAEPLVATEAVPDDPGPPPVDEALEIVAMAYRGLGEADKALRYIERAVQIAPDNASHLNNYGVLLAENGMLAQAKAQWRRVLEIDEGNATARQNLSAFEP